MLYNDNVFVVDWGMKYKKYMSIIIIEKTYLFKNANNALVKDKL